MEQPYHVAHQFDDIKQQNEAYNVGMWTFLVTEIMFFGGLFGAYVIYRMKYQDAFFAAHHELDWKLGGLNTFILLTSSLSMALGVHFCQLRKRKATIFWLFITILFAIGFLVVKYFEYSAKFHHHLVPGPNFQFHEAGIPVGQAQMFFCLYFAMTGLHAIHVIIGIIAISIIVALWARSSPVVTRDVMPTEMTGLYWHFVDIVWIFLYPLLYLIPKH